MYIEELLQKLADVGVDVSRKTLRRWADQGLISNRKQCFPPRGRGNTENWPFEAFEEAAAVWAVKKAAEKRLSLDEIKNISTAALQVFRTPQANYEWSQDVDLCGPDLSLSHPYGYRVLKMQFSENAFDLFENLIQLRKYSRHLKPLLKDGRLPVPLDSEELTAALDEFMLLLKDGRLLALLGDEEISTALDRFIVNRSGEESTLILLRVVGVLIRSPLVFKLAKTWAATVIKARYHMPINQPAKIVFHWRSRPSTIQDRRWNELYTITLEDPEPIASVFADYDEDFVSPDEERNDEDEIVIFFDSVDVREKVFYAPFEEWYEFKQMKQ
ncbi:MAG: hypothetical protein ACXV5H_11435 [Halobacteriota archaeon]